MQIRKIFYLFIFISLVSCSEDEDITLPRNLQEYVDVNANRELDNVIACAASVNGSTSLSYVFYYPIEGATEIRYYEAESTSVDENDFSKYRRELLTQENVFGGKLKRFLRSSSEESWCVITYKTDGKFHMSNPIRLKNQTKPTEWTDEVTIEYPEITAPKFTWEDGVYTDTDIYFQVVSDEEIEEGEEVFISGTYTNDKEFKFSDATDTTNTDNIVLDINTETPRDLVEDEEYLFTMMGVSEDNWVNLVIQKSFVPRNLEEYIGSDLTTSIEITPFAASANGNNSVSYIYYYPIEGATDIRYYETENTSVDQNDLSKYRRVFLSSENVFGGKLKRFSRSNSEESWCILTYLIDDQLYTSEPLRLKNQTEPTEWKNAVDDITIDQTISLMPEFSWLDGSIGINVKYFQMISTADGSFLSWTSTSEKKLLYDASNLNSTISTDTPEDLILDNNYNITVMGLSDDNWVNLMIEKSFIVEE